jgi:hypothetical protein
VRSELQTYSAMSRRNGVIKCNVDESN